MKIFDKRKKLLLETPDSSLQNAKLAGANLRWSILHGVNLEGADLREADLEYSDLWNAKLRYACLNGTYLKYASLQNADLRDTDLREADLESANLSEAKLKGAILPDYEKIPFISNIHKKIYEAASQPNALCMDLWHTCATTHCRAGWVIALAGEGGKALEDVFGANVAAALVYMKSDPNLEHVPNWYADNEMTLADMRRLAA